MKSISNKKEYGNIIVSSKIPIVVDFFAEWCGPCKRLTPKLEELEQTYKDKILFLKVDVDNNDCSDICELYNITSMPTLIFIKDSLQIDDLRIEGYDIEKVETNIKKFDNIKT
tara:strand:- start:319 stop:657 length:339 start_codon:yes stop_codon:yes gene_type:complete